MERNGWTIEVRVDYLVKHLIRFTGGGDHDLSVIYVSIGKK